jgi:hypothetical protein
MNPAKIIVPNAFAISGGGEFFVASAAKAGLIFRALAAPLKRCSTL